jgi:hypothetical protein
MATTSQFRTSLHFSQADFTCMRVIPREALVADDPDTREVTEANFGGATFTEGADFEGATFTEGANFGGATFTEGADFEGATFTEGAEFGGATFTEGADFGGATFTKGANFVGATFTTWTNFEGATFTEGANFINAEMKGETNFSHAVFAFEPPRFFGAKLHEGTAWYAVTWPRPPKDARSAERFVAAYERLKLEMDKLKKHGDELDFFARELRSRRVLLGFWRGLPFALYGALCGYGRYYMRPLALLAILVVLGAVPIRAHFGGGWSLSTFISHGFGGGALGLSFANTFSALGFRKDLINPQVLDALPGWLRVIAAIQTILGIVLLFLFGLAVRNRFRMK